MRRAAPKALAAARTGDKVLSAPEDPIRWIETEFYIPETNAAIQLEPYQRIVLRKALTCLANGDFPYSLVLWSDLKKSAKSTIAAAVVLWLAWHHDWETCRVVANDLKQANSRTFYYIERAIQLNPRLRAVCKSKTYHIDLPNHTKIDAIPVDPKGEAGGGDLITCFTELWAAKNEAAKQLWTETTLSPLKYGRSLRWCESYAGYIGASPILEQVYEAGVKQGIPVSTELPDLELYENPNARLLALWNTRPRCSWQTQDYYTQEQSILAPSEFSRIHGNVWAQAQESFIPIEWWDACRQSLEPREAHQSVVVAIDAATTNDCFAIVSGTRKGETVELRTARKWIPPQGGKLDFSNPANPNDPETPEGYLRWLANTYPVVEFAYDEYQLHELCTRLRRSGVGFFKPFPQGEPRAVADKQLYDLIRDRRIVHDGSLVDVRQHLLNADRTPEGKYLRIVKREEKLKIDLAVTLSMLASRVLYLNL